LNNQPQGGFITRKPSAPRTVVASDNGFIDNGFGFFFQRAPDPSQQPQQQPGNLRMRGGRAYYPDGRPYYPQAQPQQQGWGWPQQQSW
jgi:hypothetical protein